MWFINHLKGFRERESRASGLNKYWNVTRVMNNEIKEKMSKSVPKSRIQKLLLLRMMLTMFGF